jgi:hypothetical protein
VYTNALEIGADETFAHALLNAANKYQLEYLKLRTQRALISIAGEKNCTNLLLIADASKSPQLRKYAMDLIVNYFDAIDRTRCWTSSPSSPCRTC